MRITRLFTAVATALLVAVSACGGGDSQPEDERTATVTTAPSISSDEADRAICLDLDTRGGTFYNDVFEPFMTKTADGPIQVNVQSLDRSLEPLKDLSIEDLEFASEEIADMAERLRAAARTYRHREDATTLLNSFGILALHCEVAGHAPMWFDSDKFDPEVRDQGDEESPEPAETTSTTESPTTIPGEGVFKVGEDVMAGTYVSPGPKGDGYYCVAFTSRKPDDVQSYIRGTSTKGQAIVEIRDGEYFSTKYCKEFVLR